MKKVETSLNVDSQEFAYSNDDSVEKLWSLLESHMRGQHASSTDAEVQVDAKVSYLFHLNSPRECFVLTFRTSWVVPCRI